MFKQLYPPARYHARKSSTDRLYARFDWGDCTAFTTKDLATHSQSGGQFFGIHASNAGRVMIFAGGLPLMRAGRIVGAIGVSGGSGEQDQAVAEAGAAAFA